jgi:cytochrome b561
MTTPLRYHKALVALHWLMAIMLTVALFIGSVILVDIPNSSPEKVDALRGHMIVGIVILLLTIIRLIVRLKTAKPAPATTGNPLLDKVGYLTHWLLYILVFAMIGSGIALAVQSNLAAAVFMKTALLPENFQLYAPRLAHGIIAKALMALIGLHVLAALYHQFVRKDGLIARMWWAK